MTHTPWKIDPVPPLAVIEDNEDGNGVCEIDGDPTHPETLANAALIIAAPDLLAALEDIGKHAVANNHGSFNVSADRIRDARRLAAKARPS